MKITFILYDIAANNNKNIIDSFSCNCILKKSVDICNSSFLYSEKTFLHYKNNLNQDITNCYDNHINNEKQNIITIELENRYRKIIKNTDYYDDIFISILLDDEEIEYNIDVFRLNKIQYYNNTKNTFKYKFLNNNNISLSINSIRIPEKGQYSRDIYKVLDEYLQKKTNQDIPLKPIQ